ncbi:MAG: phosphoribosylamine--glycine ligase, partial [Nitrososphaeraceae archaeon]|nr:phosphoribosylamine--glycine ligase [Nitrososphaeraceae archaeon]
MDNKENVLIVGSGGREHSIGWKISQSPRVNKIYYAPGNGGTFENINIGQNDFEKIASYAKNNSCLTIVGPEEPLSLGIVDFFNQEKLRIFGPTRTAAKLESSKIFAKEFMNKHGIQTARYQSFDNADQAKEYVSGTDGHLVVKADGLASGKGVFVCDTHVDVIRAIDKIMINKEFGKSGEKIVIEEKITGEEISFIGISDGNTILPLATSQDHKRAFDDDKGPNTGGMGSYSPAPIVDEILQSKIMDKIMIPTIRHMKYDNNPFKGFLYAGLMINKETREPYVLEYNI